MIMSQQPGNSPSLGLPFAMTQRAGRNRESLVDLKARSTLGLGLRAEGKPAAAKIVSFCSGLPGSVLLQRADGI